MVAPFVHDKFDIGILRQNGSTKVGMMLVKDKYGSPSYKVYDDEYLAAQFFSGAPGYGNLPPEKELALRQDDWRSGFGLDVYDSNDPKRYLKSIGMDMRFRGMGIAGPTPTAASIPTHYTASDWNYGDRTEDPDSKWTNDDNVLASAGNATANDEAGWGSYIYVYFPAMNCSSIRFAWGESTTNVVTGWTVGYYNLDTNAWVNAVEVTGTNPSPGTVTAALGATKTISGARVRIEDQSTGQTYTISSIQMYAESATIQGITIGGIDFNDELYLTRGNTLLTMNSSTGTITVVTDGCFIENITDLEVFSDDKLYIALGLSQDYWEMTTGEAFTKNTLANNSMKYFAFVHTTVDTMYASDGVNTVRSTVDPADGGTAWSAQTTVGSSYHEFTRLMEDNGALFLMKSNIPYYLDSSGNVQTDLAADLSTETVSTDNGKNTALWQGNLYLPWGDQTLLEIASGVNTFLNPADFSTTLPEFNGQVFAAAGDSRYLYTILDYSTKVEVLSGRYETIDGSTSWVWHPIAEITLTGCETAFISSIFQKRLWITSTLAADSIYFIPLPTGYGNITTDANRKFKTGVTMTTSLLHGNFKSTKKAFPELELVMGHSYDVNVYFTVAYKKLGDGSWTSIGNFKGSATSMTESKFIPVDGSSNNPVSTMFQLRFTAVTDDTDLTPVLLNYPLKGILYPSQREIIACQVYCSNEISLKDGGFDRGSFDTIVATLNEARSATWPVTFYDIDNATQTVKFLPLPSGVPRWELIAVEKNRKKERAYNLLMQVVALS